MERLTIIGAGPAGLTAGVYAARKNLGPLMINDFITYGGQLLDNPEIENYPGLEKVSGYDLSTTIKKQLDNYEHKRETDKIKNVYREKDILLLESFSGNKYETKSLIIATGTVPREIGLPKEKDLVGSGISYCTTCDGPLFMDKVVAVLGNNSWAFKAALEMADIAKDVLYFNYGKQMGKEDLSRAKQANIRIYDNAKVTALIGEERLEKISIRSGSDDSEIEVDGMFVELGKEPNTDMVKDLVKLNQRKEIIVDKKASTDTDGVFAAGDCTNSPHKQIITAASQGAIAALSAYEYVKGQEGK